MKTVKLPKHSVLCRQDDLNNKSYVLIKGSIKLKRKHRGVDLEASIDAPALIGHPELFHRKKYLATSTADTDIEVVELDAGTIEKLMNEADPLTRLLIEGLTGYVGQLLDIAIAPKKN